MTRFDLPLCRPPMLARGHNRIAGAFGVLNQEVRRLDGELAALQWERANDPDESTETVAVMPRALDLAAGRVS